MSRKNPFKGAIILTVFAIVTVGLYFLLNPYFENSSKDQDNATLLLGGIGREEIYELRIKNDHGTFHIKKRGDKAESWTVSEESDPLKSYEADTSSVNGIVSTLLAARKESTLNDVKLPELSLQPPRYEIQVNYSNENKTLYLGQDTPVDYLVYAKWSQDADAFLTSRSLKFGIDKKLSEIRNKKVFDLQLANLQEIKWEVSKGHFGNFKGLHLNKDENGNWTSQSSKPIALVSSEINNFLEGLNKLSVKEFASEDISKIAEYGLHSPDITFSLKPQSAETPPTVWQLSKKEQSYFMNLKGGNTIYEISASIFDHFRVELMKFRDNKISNIPSDSIIDIRIEFPQYPSLSLSKTDKGWKFKEGDTQLDANEDKVREIIAKLHQLNALEYLDDQTPQKLGLDKPLRIVDLTYQENNDKKNKIFFFGKSLDTSLYAVNSEGLQAAASVKLDLEELLPENVDSYRVSKASASKEPAANSLDAPKDTMNSDAQNKKGTPTKMQPTVSSPKEIRKLPAAIVKAGHKYTAKMTLSNGKTLEILFDAEKAPYTVSNFLHLARNKFYDGVVFHRVIANFVIQGGDPTGTGTGGPGYKFDNEDNNLKHLRGALSMAHAGRNTNGSQFFIVLAPQPHLDGLHTVFGNVTKGQEFLDEVPQGTKMTQVEVFEEAL